MDRYIYVYMHIHIFVCACVFTHRGMQGSSPFYTINTVCVIVIQVCMIYVNINHVHITVGSCWSGQLRTGVFYGSWDV